MSKGLLLALKKSIMCMICLAMLAIYHPDKYFGATYSFGAMKSNLKK
jgi:hypothetical protein